VNLAMMSAAERDGKFIADLAPECPALNKAQMMRITGNAAADQARLFGEMRRDSGDGLLAQTSGFVA